jgi:hypothetical protein
MVGFSSNWMTLKEAQDNQLGCGDRPDYFTTVATVLMVKSENSLYKACPTAECNKKVGSSPFIMKQPNIVWNIIIMLTVCSRHVHLAC